MLIVPQTRLPVQIYVNKLLSFDPEVIADEQQVVHSYRWPLETLLGKSVNFSDSEEKVVLINFWATWCAPCIAEMPSLQALYEKYGQQVDFYFVTSDRKESIQGFMRENDYTFPVYLTRAQAPEPLIEQTLPTTFLIDQNGVVVVKEFGTADWNSKAMHQILDRLLAADKKR